MASCYGLTYAGPTPKLTTLDLDTGVATGSETVDAGNSLATRSATGEIYLATNWSTPSGVYVGMGQPGNYSATQHWRVYEVPDASPQNAHGMEFDELGDLYVALQNGNFYQFNPDSTSYALIGAIGYECRGSIAFDPNDSDGFWMAGGPAYATPSLIRVDKSTGAGTLIGAIGYGYILALYHDGTTLYGISNTTRKIYTINTTTGAGTEHATLSPAQDFYGASPVLSWALRSDMKKHPFTGAKAHVYNTSGTIRLQWFEPGNLTPDTTVDILTGQGSLSPAIEWEDDGRLRLCLSDGSTRKESATPWILASWGNWT